MTDSLLERLAPQLFTALRKCEWCCEPSERGRDLCADCETKFRNLTTVPPEAGHEAECVFGLLRSAGVLW